MKPIVLRVASFNVHFGKKTDAIANLFIQHKNLAEADIIFFQEIEFYEREKVSRAENIARKLGYFFHYAPARPTILPGSHGIATLSRFPLLDNEILKLPKFNMVIHTRQRIALISHITLGGNAITLCNIHLDARLNTKQRLKQLDFALKRLEKEPNVIIGGDFNTIPLFLAGRIFPVGFVNQVKKIHTEMTLRGFTHFCQHTTYTMKKVVPMKLDHIYSNTFPIESCGVETSVRISDHKPIWADLIIPKSEKSNFSYSTA